MLGLVREGWRRGFVFFAVDLVGFVVAVLAAVRLHEVFASVYDGLGLAGRWASIFGGLTIFVPVIVVVAIVGGRASKAMYRPGLWMTNRVLGVAFAAALGVAVVIVGLVAARAARIPVASGLVERSPIAGQVVEASAPAIAAANESLGLGLCEGRFASSVPEVCSG